MSEAFAHQLASGIEAAAVHFWGDPAQRLNGELRWGARGSKSVDLTKGVWCDHEAGTGGGVMALVERENGMKGSEAVRYLRNMVGLEIDDARPDHLPTRPKPANDATPRKIVATYDYADLDGKTVFQVVRMEPKDFRQRRPDPQAPDGWSWSVKGVKQVPYRLADLFALEGRGTVYVVEGEKDADLLSSHGLTATCNAGGAGKWPEDLSAYFDGLDVVIVPDNDEAGRKHADVVAASVRDYANSVRVLTLPALPVKGDVSDWIADGNDAKALPDFAARAPLWTPKPPESRFGAIQWSEIDAVGIRQDWLVEDLIFEGDSALIFGASGSGKSFLAVDMGLSIARGVPFLGKPTRKGAVLYQAGEGGKGLVKRLRAYRQQNMVVGDVPFVLLPSRVNLFSEDGDAQDLLHEIVSWKAVHPDLAAIFIDTLSCASPGANENSSEDMSRLLAFGDQVQKLGVALFWVHHKNAAGDRERGHTSLRANVDSAIEVNRDEEDNRSLKLVKIKDGEDGEKIGFDLQSVTIGTYDSGKPMTSCVVVPAEVGSSQTGYQLRQLAHGPHLFLTVLDDVIAQKGGMIPPNVPAPQNAYGVEYDHFRDLYRRMRGSDLDDNALRQAIKREGDGLLTRGFIGRCDRWMWITADGGQYLTRFRR
jgi:hypothetical protein